jgi:hypothetical protein
MKKISILIVLIIVAVNSFAQFTNKQLVGNPKSIYVSTGALKADSGIIISNFTDTSFANSQQIKNTAGIVIKVKDTLYLRADCLCKWIAIGNSFKKDSFKLMYPLQVYDSGGLTRLRIAYSWQDSALANTSPFDSTYIYALANTKKDKNDTVNAIGYLPKWRLDTALLNLKINSDSLTFKRLIDKSKSNTSFGYDGFAGLKYNVTNPYYGYNVGVGNLDIALGATPLNGAVSPLSMMGYNGRSISTDNYLSGGYLMAANAEPFFGTYYRPKEIYTGDGLHLYYPKNSNVNSGNIPLSVNGNFADSYGNIVVTGGNNIYNADGTLLDNRIVDVDNKTLSLKGYGSGLKIDPNNLKTIIGDIEQQGNTANANITIDNDVDAVKVTTNNFIIDIPSKALGRYLQCDNDGNSLWVDIPTYTPFDSTYIYILASSKLGKADSVGNNGYARNWQINNNINSFWKINGNASTDTLINFIGTTDSKDFVFKTNNIEVARIKNTGNFGIGTNVPTAKLQVNGTTKSKMLILTGQDVAGDGLKSSISNYGIPSEIPSSAYSSGFQEYAFVEPKNGFKGYTGVQSWAYVYAPTTVNPSQTLHGKFKAYIAAFSAGQVYDNTGSTMETQMGYLSALNVQNGTVENAYDFYGSELNSILATTNTNPSVTNHYTLYSEPRTRATNNWFLYNASNANNVLGSGKTGINNATPDSILSVVGGIQLKGLYPSTNSTDSVLVVNSVGGVGKRALTSIGTIKYTTNGFGIIVDSTSTLYTVKADTNTTAKLRDVVINAKVNYTDTSSMLNAYKTNAQKVIDSLASHNTRIGNNTSNIANNTSNIALKLNITDTALVRLRPIAGTNLTLSGTYPNITFNAATQTTDTSSLSNRINAKLNITTAAATYQPIGSYLTANQPITVTATGDATGTSTSSATAPSLPLTLATVNSNIGTFGTASNVGTFTVNGKGLITAASNTAIQIAESQVTSLVSDLANKQATLVSGTNIRTINGNTLLGSTDLVIATNAGTVTNVAALTLGTTGTDLSSSVATSTTTPVITLNVPTASASNRGALSSTDWATFNAKAPTASPTFTGTVTMPTPFTLGATSVTSTGTQLNYLNSATGTTGTTSTNLVYSTSPTLVTPILGTPTSVTLTNGTGLPLTTGVTGILPIANGGTGSSTQNFVDLTTTQTVAGAKTFSNAMVVNSTLNITGTFTLGNNSLTSAGLLTLGNGVAIISSQVGGTASNNGRGIGTFANILASTAGVEYSVTNQSSMTHTTGNHSAVSTLSTFAPTSGTGTFNGLMMNNTINQTGGASGTTRGLYINPTLTAAADFRGIDVVNGSVVLPYRAVTTTTTILQNNHIVDCTSGTFNLTLPTAVGMSGKIFVVKNSGTGVITLNTTSSQLIDGTTTKTLSSQYSGYQLVSDNANWKIIATF